MKPAVLAVAALLVAAPAARADAVLAPAPGAQHVTAAGAWTAWAAPAAGGRFKLVVRAPDGTVADAAIPTFGAAPDPDFGSHAFVGQRQVVVYSRCAGASTVKGCDVYTYDPQSKRERKVRGASSSAYSETAPAIASGSVSFVRRGGRRNGVYVAVGRAGGRPPHVNRIDGHIARETAISVSRVAFLYRNGRGSDDLTLAQLDGTRKRLIRRAAPGVVSNPQVTRYKVGWLERAGGVVNAKLTDRINPSDPQPTTIRTGSRPLPASTTSIAISNNRYVDTYADAEGVKRLSPPIFRG